eukprot:82652-Amphidinium_carterae.1
MEMCLTPAPTTPSCPISWRHMPCAQQIEEWPLSTLTMELGRLVFVSCEACIRSRMCDLKVCAAISNGLVTTQ